MAGMKQSQLLRLVCKKYYMSKIMLLFGEHQQYGQWWDNHANMLQYQKLSERGQWQLLSKRIPLTRNYLTISNTKFHFGLYLNFDFCNKNDFFSFMQMLENGEYQAIWNRWKPKLREDCFKSNDISPTSLTSVASLYALLGVLIIGSIIVALFELIIFQLSKRRISKKENKIRKMQEKCQIYDCLQKTSNNVSVVTTCYQKKYGNWNRF